MLLIFALFALAVAVFLLAKSLHPVSDSSAIKQWVQLKCAVGVEKPGLGSWEPCKLPHLIPKGSKDAWYQLSVPSVDRATQPVYQGVWLAANMNAEVWVNGVQVGSGGRMEEPIARHWNDGLLFFVPHAPSHVMEVLIHVRGYLNNGSGLNMLATGAYAQLQVMHDQFVFRTSLLTFSALTFVILAGLVALLLSLWSQQIALLYFGAGCLASVLYLVDSILVQIPVSRDLWEALVYMSIAWSQMLFLLFIVCLMDVSKPWIIKAFYGYGILTLLLLVVDGDYVVLAGLAWASISSGAVCLLMLYSFRCWCLKGEHWALMVGFALFSVLLVNVYDAIPLLVFGEAAVPFLYYLGPMFFAMIMMLVLVTRVGSVYQHKMQLSIELGETLKQQSSELAAARKKTEELWKKQAIRDERDRIVRDLHDGVGGLLSNTLAHVEPKDKRIYAPLNEAVHELRMIMGTLDEDADVMSLLGELRLRVQVAVEAAGGILFWQIDGIPLQAQENTGIGMQFVRIIQESVHNALRHAKCTEITVYMGKTELWIVDNGRGFDFGKVRMGRGLKNLRWRAQQLHANFHVISKPSGTKIDLNWDEE